MRNILLLAVLVFLFASQLNAQEFKAKVIDQDSKLPVPYAAVQFQKNKGVMTNEEGQFVVEIQEIRDSLIISSMGYKTLRLKFSKDLEPVLYLKSQVMQLGDVFLTNKKLSGREIMERAREKVTDNYDFEPAKRRFFFRESNFNKVNQFDLNIDESSIEDITQDLMDSLSNSVPKNSDSFKEVLGDVFGNYSEQKIEVIRAANLHNPQSTADLQKLTDKLDKIFRENVKETSYFKIKSGLFGVKVDADDLTDTAEEDQNKPEEPSEEEKLKSENDLKKSVFSSAKSDIALLMNAVFWEEDNTFDVFEKLKKYEYEVKGVSYMNGEAAYVIDFRPKGGADFKGRAFVNAEDYGILRIDYQNVKPLKKFKLLGISTASDVFNGKMIFSKNISGKYEPKYFELEKGESFGIDRPLTLIEKNKKVAGRRKQNELDMDILIKVSQVEKYQLLIYNSSVMENGDFDSLAESEDFTYQTFKKYDASFWDGFEIMEPNEAIREFTAVEDLQ